LGRVITVRAGGDVAILSTGGLLANVVAAADALAGQGIGARVLSVHTLKPLDREAVVDAARTGAMVVVEEHSGHGGLGAEVARTLLEAGVSTRFRHLHLPADFFPVVGGQDFLRGLAGLAVADIVREARTLLEDGPQPASR
ncbi:MAG TPA: transketolase C-terminal domain-containing protein, partial [Candidatus Dormibacteraeota bacterium]|nr:transketolase C-terminal domain-containing protein [Candidatus Dormibacteraeota bacterium]